MSNLELVLVIGTTMLIWGCTYSYLKIVRVNVKVSDLEQKLTLTQEMIHSQAELIEAWRNRFIKAMNDEISRLNKENCEHVNSELTRIDSELKAEWKKVGDGYLKMNEHSTNHQLQIERGLRVIEESMEVIKGLVKNG